MGLDGLVGPAAVAGARRSSTPKRRPSSDAHRARRPRSGDERPVGFHARGLWCASAKKRFAKSLHVDLDGSPPARASGSRDKRRGQATRKRTRPHKRPLKRARRLLKRIQHTHKNKRIRLFSRTRRASARRGVPATSGGSAGQRPPGLCDKRFTFALYGAFFVKGPRAGAYPIISTSVSLFDLAAVSSPRPNGRVTARAEALKNGRPPRQGARPLGLRARRHT